MEGVNCFHVNEKHPDGDVNIDLWIGKADYLIREIRYERPLGVTEFKIV